MKIYWGTNSIPELAGLSSNERNKVWRSCVWKCYTHWQTWLGLALCGAISGIGAIVAGWLFPYVFSWQLLVVALFGGVGGLIFGQIAAHQVRPHLKAYLESEKGDTSFSKRAS